MLVIRVASSPCIMVVASAYPTSCGKNDGNFLASVKNRIPSNVLHVEWDDASFDHRPR